MSFAPRSGCPMCSIVSSAQANLAPPSPVSSSSFLRSPSTSPEILWRDDNFTAYLEKTNPVSSKGHIVIVLNLHVPSIYALSSGDLPLLTQILRTADRLLTSLSPPPVPPSPDPSGASFVTSAPLAAATNQFHIGFINYPFKDNKIPVTDHLHVHAYVHSPDLAGWWRKVAYGPLAWYPLEDLIAEIRESTSNNRIKSGYSNRQNAPIQLVPSAGARSGNADGFETSVAGLGLPDPEDGLAPIVPTRRNSSEPPVSARTSTSTPPETIDGGQVDGGQVDPPSAG